MHTRRGALALGAALVTGLAGCSGSRGVDDPTAGDGGDTGEPTTDGNGTISTTDDDTTDGDAPMALETVTEEPSSPLAFAEAPDGTRYVADRPGQVYRVGAERALDISDRVMTGGERGLLGIALHPEFGSNRRLYLRYSAPLRGGPSGYSHTFVLAEFRAREGGSIEPDSERTLLEIPEPQGNHNSGPIAFGPDGYLYVGVGDGGASGDEGTGHVEDWYGAAPGGNGQDVTTNLLGSLLRIDVDGRTGDRPYGVPDDNPLVGREGLDEHYAWGLRNPWGISFDGEDAYVADVGQNRYEEVNLVKRGGNYGWNVREATHCFKTGKCPATGPSGEPLLDPVIEYPHSGDGVSGISVIGGHLYRGSGLPALSGRYVFGDLNARGRLFSATPADEGLWETEVIKVAAPDSGKLGTLFGVGRDRAGELYVLTRSGVHRVVAG